jgi:hypothetical protein
VTRLGTWGEAEGPPAHPRPSLGCRRELWVQVDRELGTGTKVCQVSSHSIICQCHINHISLARKAGIRPVCKESTPCKKSLGCSLAW